MSRRYFTRIVFAACTCAALAAAAAAQDNAHKLPQNALSRIRSLDELPHIQVYAPSYTGKVPDVLAPFHSSSGGKDSHQETVTTPLSEFDDTYFKHGAAHLSFTLPTHTQASQAAQAMRTFARDAFSSQRAEQHSVKVDVAGERLFVTISGVTEAGAGDDFHTAASAFIADVHAWAVECAGEAHALPAPTTRQRSLRDQLHGKLDHVLDCSDQLPPATAAQVHTQPQPASANAHRRRLSNIRFNIAYPTASYSMDHAATKRQLQTAHPSSGGVFARQLSPPVFASPIMLAARKTHPVHTAPDGSRRYRMLAESSSAAHGNITIGYDVLLRPEALSLDDAAEVLSVTCSDKHDMLVVSMHPLNITTASILEGSKEWGCVLSDDGKAHAFVARVESVSSEVLPSGMLQYSLRVFETEPFSAASIWDSVMIVSPPDREAAAAARERRRALGLTCDTSKYDTLSATGYALFDCETDGTGFGNYDYNYNRATRRAKEEKLYPIPSLRNIWFDNTYAYVTTVVELQMAFYAGANGVGLPLFEVKLRSEAAASITLKAKESRQVSSSWSDLTDALDMGSFALTIGFIPVRGAASAKLVTRKPSSTAEEVQFEVGASASASASLGLRYSNRLTDPSDSSCYCVSDCSCATFGCSPYCFVNEGCRSAEAPDGTGPFKWKYCSNFNQESSPGWKLIKDGTWNMGYQPPFVSAGAPSVSAGRATYHLGAELGLTLYSLIPFKATPYWEVGINIQPSRRQLRTSMSSPASDYKPRALEATCGGDSGEQTGSLSLTVGKTGADVGIDDVKFALNIPVVGTFERTLVSGRSFSDTVLSSNEQDAGAAPVCSQAAPQGQTAINSGGNNVGAARKDGDEGGGVIGPVVGVLAAVVLIAIVVALVMRSRKKQTGGSAAQQGPGTGMPAPVQMGQQYPPHMQPHAGQPQSQYAQQNPIHSHPQQPYAVGAPSGAVQAMRVNMQATQSNK